MDLMRFKQDFNQYRGFVEVSILGSSYKLKSNPEDENYLETLAKYVDDKMLLAQRNNPSFKPTKIAILTALNLADELQRYKENAGRNPEELNSFSKRLEMLVERVDNIIST